MYSEKIKSPSPPSPPAMQLTNPEATLLPPDYFIISSSMVESENLHIKIVEVLLQTTFLLFLLYITFIVLH